MNEQVASEYTYTPQTVKGVCEHCGKQVIEHIVKDGARYHVFSWSSAWDSVNMRYTSQVRCSEPDCEANHGPGRCVPFEYEENNE